MSVPFVQVMECTQMSQSVCPLSRGAGWVVGSDRKGQAQNEDLEEKSGGIEMTHFNGSDADAMPKCIEWGV